MSKTDATKFGKPVLIDAHREKARNRIHRIGIELEGGWDKLPKGVSGLVGDSSVQFEQLTRPPFVGELPSPPLDMKTWPSWLKDNYSQHVNTTCGMHVHMQPLTALTYQRLMDPRYPATIVVEFKKWAKREGFAAEHHFWGRLAGQSRYCQHKFYADEQISKAEKGFNQEQFGHRYTVIHYAYRRFGTVECRLLPMMTDAAQAQRAIQELLDVTNAFLLATAKKEPRVGVQVQVEREEVTREETRVRV